MTKTITDAAAELSECLDIPTPEGESSAAFRLSIARDLRIGPLKEAILHLVSDGLVKIRFPDGGFRLDNPLPTESSQVDIEDAKEALRSVGWVFLGGAEVPPRIVPRAF